MCRSIFAESDRWLQKGRDEKWVRRHPSKDAVMEFMMSTILLPLQCTDLSSEFCSRVVTTDASPEGHGLAYAYPKGGPNEVQRWARMASFKGCSTMLTEDIHLGPNEDDPPLVKAHLPLEKT